MARKSFVKKHVSREKKSSVEPDVENIKGKIDLIRALNWYTYRDFAEKTRKNWVIEYTQNKKLKKVDEKHFTITLSTICRLASRGFKLSEENKKFIDERVKTLLNRIEIQNNKSKPKSGPTIQERIYMQAQVVMAEVNYFVDEALQGNYNKLGSLISDFGKPHLNHVINHIQSYIDEFEENPKDYGFSTRQKNKMIKYLESLKDECNNLAEAKKKARKPRTPKKKPPVELCKNVKIADDTKVRPTKLIGAGYALLYNKKYNRLNFIVAEDVDGLTVKGTTIHNISEKKSKVFTVKDPSIFDKLPTSINLMKKYLEDNSNLRLSKNKVTGRMSEQVSIEAVL